MKQSLPLLMSLIDFLKSLILTKVYPLEQMPKKQWLTLNNKSIVDQIIQCRQKNRSTCHRRKYGINYLET